jgi:hypothetical protein
MDRSINISSPPSGSTTSNKVIVFYLPYLGYEYEISFFKTVESVCLNLGFQIIFFGLYQSPETRNKINIFELPWTLPRRSKRVNERPEDSATPINIQAIARRERDWNPGQQATEDELEQIASGIRWLRIGFQQILVSIQPALVVFWGGEYTNQLILRDLCNLYQVTVTYIERGLLPGTLFFDQKGISVNSSFQSNRTINPCLPNSPLQSARAFSFKAFVKQYLAGESWWEQPKRVDLVELLKKLGVRAGQKIIFFPSQIDGDTSNFLFSNNFTDNAAAFKWLCDTFRKDPNYFILGKHHPKSRIETAAYEMSLPPHGVWLTEIAIHDCLAVCDYVALVNSTVALEAMIYGRPTLALGESLFSGRNILYEVDEPNRAEDVISNWLTASDLNERIKNFKACIDELAASHLFAFRKDLEDIGLRSAEDFGELLCSFAKDVYCSTRRSDLFPLLNFLSEAMTAHERQGFETPTVAPWENATGRVLARALAKRITRRLIHG